MGLSVMGGLTTVAALVGCQVLLYVVAASLLVRKAGSPHRYTFVAQLVLGQVLTCW